MQYNPNFLKVKKAKWDSYFRTDFCHWLNSIYVVLNKFCNVFIISNYSHESEKKAKDTWLKENIKFKFHLILNKEGNTKSHFAGTKNDILVDDSLSNLDHWHRANGSIFAYQYVTCEKGRRHLLSTLIEE
jgi:5'(3')-deoxyribonucleotidase